MGKDLRMCLLLDFYGKTLTSKQYDAIDLYYNEDLSLAEISEHTGITRQGVRDAIVHAEQTLTKLEEDIGYVEWSSKVREAAVKISEAADLIEAYNQRGPRAQDISQRISEILEQCDEIIGKSEESDDI